MELQTFIVAETLFTETKHYFLFLGWKRFHLLDPCDPPRVTEYFLSFKHYDVGGSSGGQKTNIDTVAVGQNKN